jgi:hypothetical protein
MFIAANILKILDAQNIVSALVQRRRQRTIARIWLDYEAS